MQVSPTIHRVDRIPNLSYRTTSEEDLEIPKRSPRRPHMSFAALQYDSLKSYDMSSPTFHDTYSKCTVSRNSSAGSSMYSYENDRVDKPQLDTALVEEYLEEITGENEIFSVDSVVTIVKCHDQWDSKKVAFVATH